MVNYQTIIKNENYKKTQYGMALYLNLNTLLVNQNISCADDGKLFKLINNQGRSFD